jgi:hypothetical protein
VLEWFVCPGVFHNLKLEEHQPGAALRIEFSGWGGFWERVDFWNKDQVETRPAGLHRIASVDCYNFPSTRQLG